MKKLLPLAVLSAVVLISCSPTGPDGTGYALRSVSPAPGSVIDLAGKTTITITGTLSVEEGFYHAFVFVRDDGATFMQGMWGPAAQLDSWDKYPYKQDVQWDGHATARAFTGFCNGHVVEKAVFIASRIDILRRAGDLEPRSVYTFRDFPWGIIDYSVDIPLNYTCK